MAEEIPEDLRQSLAVLTGAMIRGCGEPWRSQSTVSAQDTGKRARTEQDYKRLIKAVRTARGKKALTKKGGGLKLAEAE
ncbi:MAG: hypothetical protein ACYDEV_03725 [Acidiferrobacter sp.]